MLDTETILIIITLATVIVGTLWEVKFWGKIAIIALAVVAAGTAVLESQNKAAETASAKSNFELLIRSVQPPAIFDDTVLDGFRKVAAELDLSISGQTIRESGERVFTFKKLDADDRISGLVFVSIAARQKLFVTFARDQQLVPLIRDMTTGMWGGDNLDTDWDKFAISIFEIAKYTLSEFVPPKTQFEGRMNAEAKVITVDITLPNGQNVGDVTFDADFIESLPKAPPIERGRMIYEKTLAQIVR